MKKLIPADPIYTYIDKTDCRNTQAVPFHQAHTECYWAQM